MIARALLLAKRRRRYKPLTDEQLAAIRLAWRHGATESEAARLAGVNVRRIRTRRADQLRDLPARGRGAGSHRRAEPPSPEEIARLAAELQELWDDRRRERSWKEGPV